MRVLPADRQGLVHLDILAGLDAAAAKDALIRIITIKRIRRVHRVGLGLEGNLLVLNREEFRRVMHLAVSVVIVADGAVKEMVTENPVEGFPLRGRRSDRFGRNLHAGLDRGRAGSHQFSIGLDHAGVAGLDGPHLGMVADLRNLGFRAVEQIDQALSRLRFDDRAVNRHFDRGFWSLHGVNLPP